MALEPTDSDGMVKNLGFDAGADDPISAFYKSRNGRTRKWHGDYDGHHWSIELRGYFASTAAALSRVRERILRQYFTMGLRFFLKLSKDEL